MRTRKTIVVVVPDIDYGKHAQGELLPAAWLLTHLLCNQLRREGRARLSSVILRKLFGKRYTRIVQQLTDSGLIKMEKNYSKGLHCREYSFAPSFKKLCYKTITEAKLVSAYMRSTTNRKRRIHSWVDGILTDPDLSFDGKKAEAMIDELTETEFKALEKDCEFNEYRQILKFGIYRCSLLHEKHPNKRLDFSSVDEFGGRFHHPFTSLPKKFRSLLKWKDKELVNVDIRNSQPLFLCLSYLGTKGQMTGDWESYKELCETGQLYESLKSQDIDRDKFKAKFFTEVLFATTNVMKRGEFGKTFKKSFPSVFRYILALKTPEKSRQLRGEDKKRPHRLAAKSLQRAESKFMFNDVIPRLKEMGIRPVIPIHDSVLTTPDHVDKVNSVILEAFGKLGLKASLSNEPA